MRACRRLLAAVAAPHRHQPAGAHSALSSSPAAPLRLVCCRMMGHGSHMSDNRPHVLEEEKRRNLEGRVPGGWNETLASESEAVVKAERAPSVDFDELQARSVEALAAKEGGEATGTGTGTAGGAATMGATKTATGGGAAAEGGAAEGAHDPSGAPAIRANIEYGQTAAAPGEGRLGSGSDPIDP